MRNTYQKIAEGSAVTTLQLLVAETYDSLGGAEKRGALSRTAEHLGMKPKDVHTHLKRYQRNVAIDNGEKVAPWRDSQHGSISATGLGRPPKLRLATLDGELVPDMPRAFDDDTDALEDSPELRQIFALGERHVKRRVISFPRKGKLRILLTSAQDATRVHAAFWDNLKAYEADLAGDGECRLMVAGFTYNKSLFGDHSKEMPDFLDATELYELTDRELRKMVFFDSAVEDHMFCDRVELEGALDMCGEMNTLPTAVTPLSGLQTYTGPRWGIFPHAKHQMEAVPTMKDAPFKANVTTGACTVPNYVPKKAGLKAEHHHTIGFVIIEALPDGRFWVRTVAADEDTGAFHDLDRYVSDGKVTRGHRVASISYGDVHHEKLDPAVARATWGYDVESGKVRRPWAKKSLFEQLRPEHQFFHDLSDFAPRNHHNIANRHWRLMNYFGAGEESVEYELGRCATFLEATARKWCSSVVVQSNHDNAYQRWLSEADVRLDPVNAELWYEWNARIARHARETQGGMLPVFELTLKALSKSGLRHVTFVDEDDSYVVYGIEHSQHGHLGPNGSRGGPANLYKVGPKLTTGHTHTPGIRDGLFTSGVCSLEMGYNKGPTSWAIAHTIGHIDGSRQILFFQKGAFHA